MFMLIVVCSHAASIILRLTYGYDAEQENDRNIALSDKALRGVMYALVVGNYLVDYLPILKRVPGMRQVMLSLSLLNIAQRGCRSPSSKRRQRLVDGTLLLCGISLLKSCSSQ